MLLRNFLSMLVMFLISWKNEGNYFPDIFFIHELYSWNKTKGPKWELIHTVEAVGIVNRLYTGCNFLLDFCDSCSLWLLSLQVGVFSFVVEVGTLCYLILITSRL